MGKFEKNNRVVSILVFLCRVLRIKILDHYGLKLLPSSVGFPTNLECTQGHRICYFLICGSLSLYISSQVKRQREVAWYVDHTH